MKKTAVTFGRGGEGLVTLKESEGLAKERIVRKISSGSLASCVEKTKVVE